MVAELPPFDIFPSPCVKEHPLDGPLTPCYQAALARRLASPAVCLLERVLSVLGGKKQAASLGGFAVLWNGLVVGMTASMLTGETGRSSTLASLFLHDVSVSVLV